MNKTCFIPKSFFLLNFAENNFLQMKNLTVFILPLLLLCACSNSNEEPQTETVLPISKHYQPCTSEFNIRDTEWVDKIKEWAEKKYVVNDLSELPNDPLGFSDSYTSVDFKEYTLLITYNLHNWNIDTYRNRYYLNNIDKIYEWAICIGTSSIPDDNTETWYFTRYAILVKKLPKEAKTQMWVSLGAINWGWE